MSNLLNLVSIIQTEIIYLKYVLLNTYLSNHYLNKRLFNSYIAVKLPYLSDGTLPTYDHFQRV